LDSKDIQIQNLINMNLKLMERINFLELRVKDLENRLSKYENPKNSRNSSVPPSKDENRPSKNQSLRESSDRKSGGQPGHKGHTREMTAHPDVVLEHSPDYCNCCGRDLSDIVAELSSKRQVIDIPVVRPVCTEHRSYTKICPCGKRTRADFPARVNSPVQYGSGIECMVSYLHSRQYLPYQRMKELLRDCFGISLSEGSIDNIIRRFAGKALPVYGMLKAAVSNSAVIGCDETGAKVDGRKHWVWTYQTDDFTVLAMSASRGLKAIRSHFSSGFGNAVLCHDAWRTYFNYRDNLHQLCCAHLLRELNYIEERYRSAWATKIKLLLLEAMVLKKTLDKDLSRVQLEAIAVLEQRLDKILETSLDKTHKEAVSIQKRLVKYRKSILTFLYHHKVPPDNNASERAIRNVKVKQKISGQFKSGRGADDFCVIRSVVDTLIKRSQNILENMTLIAKLEPAE
jgi:transposase